MKRLLVALMLAASLAGCSTVEHPPPCASDDGSGPRPCRWDATKQGDGKGTSFTVTADGSVVMDR